jgi:hypothetical protein
MTRSSKLRTIEEAWSEIERELQVRTRIYDAWVRDGKMTGIDAQDRFDRLATGCEYLKAAMTKLGKDHILNSTTEIPF